MGTAFAAAAAEKAVLLELDTVVTVVRRLSSCISCASSVSKADASVLVMPVV